VNNFFNTVKSYFTENVGVNTMASIKEFNDGSFGLLDRSGDLIQTYSRARDARRGASRRGLSLQA
jgi:hypothetical protein